MRIRVPRLRKVFLCLPLRRGVILLVYLNLIVAAAAVLTFGVMDFVKFFVRCFTTGSMEEMMHRAYRSKIHPYLIIPLLILYCLSELSMTIEALIGLHWKRLNLIKIYLYFTVIVTAFMFLFRMFDVSNFYWYYDLAAAFVYLIFKTYFIISIRSLVKKMLESKQKEPEDEQLELGEPIKDEFNPDLHHSDVWRTGEEEILVDERQDLAEDLKFEENAHLHIGNYTAS